MSRLLHAADLHLDSAFQGLEREQAALRRREQRGLLSQLADSARRERADAVLLAGDIFDGETVYRESVEALQQALEQMAVPVFITPGNHDFYSSRAVYARVKLPGNVHIFIESVLRPVALDGLGLRVWGAGYTDSVCPGLLKNFKVERQEGWTELLLLHAELTEQSSRYSPIRPAELERSGLNCAALGHVHSGGIRRAGDCLCAWPGCAAGRGFDEQGEKGALLWEQSEQGWTLRPLPLNARRYREARVDIASPLATLPENCRRDIYRLILSGESAVAPDLTALQERLQNRFFALELRDETTRPRSLWEGCGEQSLRGLFLRRMKARVDAADAAERETLLLALRLGLAALEGREEP